MPRIPNIHIRTDPKFYSEGSLRMVIKVDEKKAARVKVFLKDFPNEVELGYRIGAMEFATKLHRLVVRCLKTGTPPKGVSWPPHSPATTKMLGPHKLLNLTGFYMRSIKILQGQSLSGTIAVGLPRGLKRPNGAKGSNKLTMRQIAQLNEYGGGKVPARPLWRPAYQQCGGAQGVKKSVTKWVRRVIKEEIKRCNMVGNSMSLNPRRGAADLNFDVNKLPTLRDSVSHAPVTGADDLPF